MSWYYLLFGSMSMVMIWGVQSSGPKIPGPHYPEAAGAPGDELVRCGTIPSFLSYRSVDQEGNDHVYVPVYVAVYTDAGESTNKDVRQNSDKSISIQGNGVFRCAFGHPYRQFAFQDKYKWQQFSQNFRPPDARIPAIPLIRSFLVESHVVKDIMLQSTTERYNKIDGFHDFNVDQRATNQFGIYDESESRLETFALPGSLVTYVEDIKKLGQDEYIGTVKSWGEIRDVADLKRQFNVPTEISSSPETSIFVTVKKKKNNELHIDIANFDDVAQKINDKDKNEWNAYLLDLEKMDFINNFTDFGKLQMFDLAVQPIEDYPVFEIDIPDLTIKQENNIQHQEKVQQLVDSFELLSEATTNTKFSWGNFVSKTDPELEKSNGLKNLKNIFIKLSVDFMSGKMNFENIEKIKKEVKNNKQLQWKFCSTLDELQTNLELVSIFLEENKVLKDFPSGEYFSKFGLYEYYKNSLVSYIQSNELNQDMKNDLIRHINTDNPTKRELFYSNDVNTDSKFFVGGINYKKHILFPGDALTIEFVGQDVDALQIKSYTSDVFDSILSISPPKKVTFTFPDTNLDDTAESTWKKYAVKVGDYLKDSMRVQSIDLTFKDSKLLTYNMISHIIEGNVKEMPVRLVNGHLVVDDRIAPVDIIRAVGEKYNGIVGDKKEFEKLLFSKRSDILFVPTKNGLFMSNPYSSRILNSINVEDYTDKKFDKPIKNEIIVELIPPDEAVDDPTQINKRSPASEASDMLAAGYRQKNRKANVIPISATTENGFWEINLENSAGIESYDDVRITLVGIGDTSSEDGVWKLGRQNSNKINDLLKLIKRKFNINERSLQRVSVVACYPESSSGNLKDSVNAAVNVAKDVAKENKLAVSTRVGYVSEDEEGRKWFSATKDGNYHNRQYGDVFLVVWDEKKGVSIITKTSVEAGSILFDDYNKMSGHLGIKQNVGKEHESDILKGGYDITKTLRQRVESGLNPLKDKLSQGLAIADNPKVQRILQKVGNYMSAYGMLQTATSLINGEECEENEYTSKEACEARKAIEVIGLTQEATEIVLDAADARINTKNVKPSTLEQVKVSKVGKSSIKSFKSLGKSALRNSLKGLPVLGVGLDMASLGLDIYDLTKAKTPTDKGIAGTGVALSSLSVIAGGTALVAGLMGATAVAAVAGPAALVVGLISFVFSIGVSIWQTEQYEKNQVTLVNQAARYFESINSLYGGSWHYCENATLYMKSGIAFKTININDKFMEVNSEYLCETRKANWKTNYRIYPFLFGSTICNDYSSIESNCYCQKLRCAGMVNVRLGMNIDSRKTMQCGELDTIVLTSAPIVLRGYSYAYFDTYDPYVGLHDKNPQSKFQGSGHSLAREIARNYSNFDYEYKFCWDKYAIINNIGKNKYLPSVTNIELGSDIIRVIVPEIAEPSFVTLSLKGITGLSYTVYLSNSCRVVINSYPNSSISTDNQSLWKIIVDAELADLSCDLSGEKLVCAFGLSHLEINNTQENQVLIIDANNIIAIPVYHNNETIIYTAVVHASSFSSDQDLLNVMSRYFLTDTVDLSMAFTPVKNLSISRCGYKHIALSYLSRKNNSTNLHYTSEFQYQCSDLFNMDAKVQLLANDTIYYSSSKHSLVWRSDFLNNSLLAFAKLPCQSENGSDVSVYVVQDQIYIKQIIEIPYIFKNYIKVEAVYRLTFTRLFLLYITSDFDITWSYLERYCFQPRKQIFSTAEQIFVKTMEISAGENDLTFVNTSNEVYWVRKTGGNVEKRIFPNLGVKCDSIDISFSNDSLEQSLVYGVSSSNASSTMNDELFYFLCKNGNDIQMYAQSGNNRAKAINSLHYQNIYIKRNEILLQNETETFTFDDAIPSKMCLFEYNLNLPYTAEESFNTFMVGISEKYECVESKTKLKFKQLVGWFDFEESVTVIVHESIASYDLKPTGATRDLTKYWIWDTFNQSLYLQSIAEPSILSSLLVGNISEHDYQTMIVIPENVFVDAQEVAYESGRIYVYSSDGATYYVDEEGNSKILSVTDFWFSRHPNAMGELLQNSEKETVMFRRPREQLNEPNTTSRFKRSVLMDKNDPLINSQLYHIPSDKVFDVDLTDSSYVGSNENNMSIYTFNYNSQEFLEFDEDGNVIGEDKYSIIHRVDQTLIVESSNATENHVPPFIDGIKTIILSSYELEFQFHITEELWSKVDEILLHEDSAKLIIYLDMFLCDYNLESIGGKFVLLDYAHRKKLVIPNAEQRSKAGLVFLYVCGIQIVLHYTKTYHIQILITFVTCLFLTTIVVMYMCCVRRRHKKMSPTKKTGFVQTLKKSYKTTRGVVLKGHVRVAANQDAVLGLMSVHPRIKPGYTPTQIELQETSRVQREHVQVEQEAGRDYTSLSTKEQTGCILTQIEEHDPVLEHVTVSPTKQTELPPTQELHETTQEDVRDAADQAVLDYNSMLPRKQTGFTPNQVELQETTNVVAEHEAALEHDSGSPTKRTGFNQNQVELQELVQGELVHVATEQGVLEHNSVSSTKRTGFNPNQVELQETTTGVVQSELVEVAEQEPVLQHAPVSSTKQTGFIPNLIELQEITQGVVQSEHVRVAEQRAAVMEELRREVRRDEIEHRILTRF